MYDSTNSADIPAGAQMVAGYTDGLYAWSAADWIRHRSAVHVRICAVSIDMTAHVADVENGALTPAQGAEFVVQKIARGEIPTLYASLGLWNTLAAAVRARGVRDDQWLFWVADWDRNPNSLPLSSSPSGSYVAHQYSGSATSGGHYDLSSVADFWPGVESGPAAAADSRAELQNYISTSWVAFWTRPDISAGWAAGRHDDVFGEWLKESFPAFWTRPDISAGWAAGRRTDVLGQWLKENTPLPPGPSSAPVVVPPPVVAPPVVPPVVPLPNPSAPPVDQVRASYSSLGDFLVHALPDAINGLLRLLGLYRG